MSRHEQAHCGSDKLQHAPAPKGNALKLRVQLNITFSTVHCCVRSIQWDMQELEYSRKNKDAFSSTCFGVTSNISVSIGCPSDRQMIGRARASELHPIFSGCSYTQRISRTTQVRPRRPHLHSAARSCDQQRRKAASDMGRSPRQQKPLEATLPDGDPSTGRSRTLRVQHARWHS